MFEDRRAVWLAAMCAVYLLLATTVLLYFINGGNLSLVGAFGAALLVLSLGGAAPCLL